MKIKRTGIRTLATVLIVAALPAVVRSADAVGPYRIVERWKVAGDGRWDDLHVDSAAHRLYVTHGDHVAVVDTRTGRQVGDITGLHGTHGVALDTAGKYGYISDGAGNAVVVFDRATLAQVATVAAGENPDAIVFEPATRSVWAFNGRSKDATVIDGATFEVLGTVPLPGKPEFAVVDGAGNIFDNIEDRSEIVRIDARSRTVKATWSAGCESPSGLAFDAAGHRLFSVCDGQKMSVVDAETGRLIASATICDGPDGAGWSAAHTLAFASCGAGVLSVVDASRPGYPTIETLPTQRGARTMTYDAATDRVYLVTAELGPRPAPTPENPRPRPSVVPGTFSVLVVGRQ